MNKLSVFAGLMVLISASASQAADRQTLTAEMIDRVAHVPQGFERARVYLRRGLVIKRTGYVGRSESSSVGGGLETRITDKTLRETINRKARGRIVSVEGAERIHVSFDAGCTNTDCAFTFDRTDTCRSNPHKTCYGYVISSAPANPSYTNVEIRAKNLWFGTSSNLGKTRLQVDYDELYQLIRERQDHGGWN